MLNFIKEELIISVTENMDVLNNFFEINGLEISEDEPVVTNVIKAWRVDNRDIVENSGDVSDSSLVAGICLAFREGAYIIDGIAVDESLRGKKVGEYLLNLAIDEVKKRGGNEIFLVARSPGFFFKQGFEEIGQEGAPLFYECAGCEQYNVTCFPKIMVLHV
ncbi:MAG: GNAT family N-acetyltransferase [Eubacteriales bacterium]|nr:GNAT family N-acetyltransferase [Eubacteriales bacterium]MDY3333022.1 GNAT family N-acetyltransferase [Gallibacter sp.]